MDGNCVLIGRKGALLVFMDSNNPLIVLLVIDSLIVKPLRKTIQEAEYISFFPTMSVTIDSNLLSCNKFLTAP